VTLLLLIKVITFAVLAPPAYPGKLKV